MIKKIIVIYLFLSFININCKADEGMWLSILMDSARYAKMKELGSKLNPEDIYSINNSSLKDAVVLFDRGCTGVMVSENGLLLTNHHCGYKSIQNHSSVERNYLKDGFWAKTRDKELPNPSLKVSFLLRMQDVTVKIIGNIPVGADEITRNYYIEQNIDALIATESYRTGNLHVIKPFFGGNQYFIFEYEVFTDVRLVGAPPSDIGKFGGDTDNWEWPRHTGDFSVFRVYAGKDNKPAPYSVDNVPYKPKKIVPISLKGLEEGEFTMVYGYPAYTYSYLYSGEVDFIINKLYPDIISIRSIRLNAMKEDMETNPLVKIQYASKYFGVSNVWKKYQGVVRGLRKAKAVELKKESENKFRHYLLSDTIASKKYKSLLISFNKIYSDYNKLRYTKVLYDETFAAIEMLSLVKRFNSYFTIKQSSDTVKLSVKVKNFSAEASDFFKNYNSNIDRNIFAGCMREFIEKVSPEFRPIYISKELTKNKSDYRKWTNKLFSRSIFCDSIKIRNAIKKLTLNNIKKLEADPAYKLYREFSQVYSVMIIPEYDYITSIVDSLYRQYISALLLFKPKSSLYPDANQTLRISYGKAEGYSPADAVTYKYFTTTDGILEKENPEITDYYLSPKVKELYSKFNFGQYADKDGKLRVCFTASNHTSGGNSGSPVFNGKGELVGLNFDRCWEGTMSDILYDPEQCRNIVLDIRYILFVIDKYAKADYLIKEMKID